MPDGMPSWEEWNKQLTEEQRQYSMYKVLIDLYNRDCNFDKRLKKLEKWQIVRIAGNTVGGIFGGFMAIVIAMKFKLFG